MNVGGDVLGLIAVYGYVGLVILGYVLIEKRGSGESKRKFVHILIGNIVFFWWLFDSSYVMAFLAAGPFVPLLYLCSPRSKVSFAKGTVLEKVSAQGHDMGLFFYAVSWVILALFLFNDLAIASIGVVAMAYGDGMGCVIGRRFGRRPIGSTGKTVEGSLAVLASTLIASLVVLLFYAWLIDNGFFVGTVYSMDTMVIIALMSGIWVSLIELLTPGAYDNLTIPLSTALLLKLMGF